MITSFANPRVAQAFVDYMATQGIILTIQQHTQSDIWLADESQAGRVQAELARFLENPAFALQDDVRHALPEKEGCVDFAARPDIKFTFEQGSQTLKVTIPQAWLQYREHEHIFRFPPGAGAGLWRDVVRL